MNVQFLNNKFNVILILCTEYIVINPTNFTVNNIHSFAMYDVPATIFGL